MEMYVVEYGRKGHDDIPVHVLRGPFRTFEQARIFRDLMRSSGVALPNATCNVRPLDRAD